MHEIFYIKGFEEPWWMFEGWEEDIVSQKAFNRFEEAHAFFEQQKQELGKKFSSQKSKGEGASAFWNDGDLAFCEDCEENMQIYHGLLWLYNKKPIKSF
jgi:hypothetical protein